MHELQLSQVFSAIEEGLRSEDLKRVEALVWPAVEQYPEISQLWFYGGCVFYKTGRAAVAREMFNRAIELEDSPMVYANLGACLRRMNLHQEGIHALELALDKAPDYPQALVNLGAMYVNEGAPELGIPYLERARELGVIAGKMERGAIWNLGLLYLEAGRFGEGFDCYRTGISAEREKRNYGSEKFGIPEPKWLDPADPRTGKTLIVYGEQGIGDELMYGTMLEEARRDFGEVIFECHPRLETLHQRAHPELRIYPTRKEEFIPWPVTDKIIADYKCPIGDLGAIYRRETSDFLLGARDGLYRAPDNDTPLYRQELRLLAGDRPIVGLATRGGVMQTARQYRTIRNDELDRLLSETRALFVALDYDDVMDMVNYIGEKHGEERIKWWPSIVQHYDYFHCADLIQATDLTLTVCQSVAHLSAGLGHPTQVLTPNRCAWRYAKAPGIPDDAWYWWPHKDVQLLRQGASNGWGPALDKAVEAINAIQTS
jgi:tetratricopeptide (TPR) repeat protein